MQRLLQYSNGGLIMIINTQEVESLINSKVPALRISEETGLSTKGITNYRTGKAKLGNMTRGYLEKLQQFHNVHKDDKATDSIKIKGIRKAVTAFNNWHGAARVYFDKSEMKVWTNVYADGNSWDDYHDDDIVEIANKLSMLSRDAQITMREIRELVTTELMKNEI